VCRALPPNAFFPRTTLRPEQPDTSPNPSWPLSLREHYQLLNTTSCIMQFSFFLIPIEVPSLKSRFL